MSRKLEIPRLSVNNLESSYIIREQAVTDTFPSSFLPPSFAGCELRVSMLQVPAGCHVAPALDAYRADILTLVQTWMGSSKPVRSIFERLRVFLS